MAHAHQKLQDHPSSQQLTYEAGSKSQRKFCLEPLSALISHHNHYRRDLMRDTVLAPLFQRPHHAIALWVASARPDHPCRKVNRVIDRVTKLSIKEVDR